jgi:putative transposase
MDFVADALFNGRRFRALTVVDNYSRECLEIEVGQSLKGEDVVRVMERLRLAKGVVPNRIKVDNGSEFISKALDKWAYENNVILEFSRHGKPTDNAFIESFNGSFRDECLNVNWFLSLDDAREKISTFKEEYNHFRPHSALGNLTPVEALSRHRRSPETLLFSVVSFLGVAQVAHRCWRECWSRHGRRELKFFDCILRYCFTNLPAFLPQSTEPVNNFV